MVPTSNKPKVLVVDDDLDNVELVERVLRREFQVQAFASATDALLELERTHFDLVIADQRMPEVTGTELLERVRQRQPQARRVILSAYTDVPDLLAAINRCRIHRFLSKPIAGRELLACARALTPHEDGAAGAFVVVDHDERRRSALADELTRLGSAFVITAPTLEVDQTELPALVVLVEPCGPEAVEAAIAALGGPERRTTVIVVVPQGAVSDAAAHLRAGVDEVVWPPVRAEELLLRLATCRERARARAETARLRAELVSQQGSFHIVGRSEPMQAVFRLVDQVAPTDVNVLVRGETGTGKELVVRAIHAASPRRDALLVAVNLSAIPESLIEAELFGHERGAFTGAHRPRAGRLEAAANGTLFLDEIGDLPPSVQPKLLRVLQERRLERLGSSRSVAVNFRLVCATHRCLDDLVRDGRFREDLYYRINVVEIDLPPLRDRPGDVRLLAEYFLRRQARRWGARELAFTDEALRELEEYSWPGNVRELEHTIERAVALCPDDGELGAGLIVERGERRSFRAIVDGYVQHGGRSLDELMADLERTVLQETLLRFSGNQSAAATKLQIPRTTLRSRLKKLGLA